MAKLSRARGPIIAAIGLAIVVMGANLFDGAYESVEPILKNKQTLMEQKTILPNQSVNSAILADLLKVHTVIIVHSSPSTDSVRLDGMEPNGMTFEKESRDGFLYHIVEKNAQTQGNYAIKISNLSTEQVKITIIFAEDPYLSGSCNVSYGIQCDSVQAATGLIIAGIIAFIVGILVGITDFRRTRKLQQK